MKYILLITGAILVIATLVSFVQYLPDYFELSNYGRGYIWGKLLVLGIGLAIIYAGLKVKKAS
ncbi:hypothetical protein Halhy_4500 [Haliscomenobacter hydrossis DSM 1100]|uniref:Uncharacterized protein n=1 Tax=Haliscomenobacter hydrossis (strain ATCC 27775 / DSM 1100 / LMG 10767 / O) TaxID=760192 RepID=F4KS95_HALH1|nr:hypothetical protein Halhy_4500 [Haliscomenobacter hydrossis DSM 1100]